jgi:hypothetical protein
MPSKILHTFTQIRPRKDHRGVDLISDALPFGRLWYTDVSDAIDYAKYSARMGCRFLFLRESLRC